MCSSWRRKWRWRRGITHTSAWRDWGNSRIKRRLGYSVSLPRFELGTFRIQNIVCSAALNLVRLKFEHGLSFTSSCFLPENAVVRTSARPDPRGCHDMTQTLLLSPFIWLPRCLSRTYSVLYVFVCAISSLFHVLWAGTNFSFKISVSEEFMKVSTH